MKLDKRLQDPCIQRVIIMNTFPHSALLSHTKFRPSVYNAELGTLHLFAGLYENVFFLLSEVLFLGSEIFPPRSPDNQGTSISNSDHELKDADLYYWRRNKESCKVLTRTPLCPASFNDDRGIKIQALVEAAGTCDFSLKRTLAISRKMTAPKDCETTTKVCLRTRPLALRL